MEAKWTLSLLLWKSFYIHCNIFCLVLIIICVTRWLIGHSMSLWLIAWWRLGCMIKLWWLEMLLPVNSARASVSMRIPTAHSYVMQCLVLPFWERALSSCHIRSTWLESTCSSPVMQWIVKLYDFNMPLARILVLPSSCDSANTVRDQACTQSKHC